MGKDKSTAPALTITGKPVDGTVKWFNPDKGFGFIAVKGYADVFVHQEQVKLTGLTGLREEDKVRFVLAVDDRRSDRTIATQIAITSSKTEQVVERKKTGSTTGTVKWFNQKKGFGFIAPKGGGKDVFVHISAVEKAGLQLPLDGKQLSFVLAEGKDGRTQAEQLLLI